MRARLIRIGNSKGVRLPKAMREQVRLGEELDLTANGNTIVISSRKRHPREGWEEAFKAAGPAADDELLFPEPFDNVFDRTEWTWPEISDDSMSSSSHSIRRSAPKSRKRGPA